MIFFIIQTINGVVFGMLLFLLAAGLTLMLGTMRIVNLAHGSYYLLGGYIGYSIAKYTNNFFLACLGGLLAIGILGMVIYKVILEKRCVSMDLGGDSFGHPPARNPPGFYLYR